jgi:hypothetical protein
MTIENEKPLAVTWIDVRNHRDELLLQAETFYNFDSPASMRLLWTDYKQLLRDIPSVNSELSDLRLIQWPQLPTEHLQLLYLSRLAPNS